MQYAKYLNCDIIPNGSWVNSYLVSQTPAPITEISGKCCVFLQLSVGYDFCNSRIFQINGTLPQRNFENQDFRKSVIVLA